MAVELEAIHSHSHYDATGAIRVMHAPGDRYTLHDGGGFTANQLATAFIAAGLAKRVDPKPKTKKSAAVIE